MKLRQVYLGLGAFVLGIAGFLATKAANNKFSTALTAFYRTTGSHWVTLFKIANNTTLTTTAGTNKTAFFKTALGQVYTMYKTASTSIPLYRK